MDKSQVAAILDEIGTLLELRGENDFRCKAYHNAARALEQIEESLAVVVAENRLGEIRGVGETLREKITTLVTSGSLPFYDDLKKQFPVGLLELLRIPGLGPKKVKVLYEDLHIENLTQLEAACNSGTVAKQKGFGARTQQKILEGIQFLSQVGHRVRLDQALEIAESLVRSLRQSPHVQRLELCGSVRRRKETIRDIDILVTSDKPEAVMDLFVSLDGVEQVVGRGETKASVMVGSGAGRDKILVQCDLRVVQEEHFPFALHYFTGSKDHNIAMRQRAQDRGLKLNEYELAGPKKRVKCKDEADLFRALDLDYIAPELRESTGEVEAAANKALPRLIEPGDLRGVFHCHTNWSDGQATLEEMAAAARSLGYQYLGLADHSQSLTIARGLTADRVQQQQAEIDALNKGFRGFQVFKGIECDILADGSLDYPDAVLETFDYLVASVHSHFNQTEEEMTQRIIKALTHPCVTMLGHATGRLLLRRDGYKVDLEAVLQAAARHGKMIEINANPYRLDLDWIHCKRARALGVMLVINPDAHSTTDLEYTSYGVSVARRGWLEAENVFNTRSLADVRKAFARR